jgi:hypothetical protein
MKYVTRIVGSMIKLRISAVIDKRELKPVYGEVFYEAPERFDRVDHKKNVGYDHAKSGRQGPVSKHGMRSRMSRAVPNG